MYNTIHTYACNEQLMQWILNWNDDVISSTGSEQQQKKSWKKVHNENKNGRIIYISRCEKRAQVCVQECLSLNMY